MISFLFREFDVSTLNYPQAVPLDTEWERGDTEMDVIEEPLLELPEYLIPEPRTEYAQPPTDGAVMVLQQSTEPAQQHTDPSDSFDR